MKGPVIKPSQKDIEASRKKREEAKKRKKIKQEKLRKAREYEEKRRRLKDAPPPPKKKRREWYTNEILDKFVNENGVMMSIILVMGAFFAVLSGVGIVNLFRGLDEIDYVLHLSFGITGVFFVGVGISVDRTFAVIKSYFPMCGDTRFTRSRVDEQANSPDTVIIKNLGVLLAPDMLIGSTAGVCAISYEDIDSFRIVESWHSRRIGTRYDPWYRSRREDYFMYKIVVRTKGFKRLAISYTAYDPDTELQFICEHCRKHNPNVKITKMRKSLLG